MHNKTVSLGLMTLALVFVLLIVSSTWVNAHFSDSVHLSTQGIKTVSIEVPVGELNVVGHDGSNISADIQLECPDNTPSCQTLKNAISLKQVRQGQSLTLTLEHIDGDWETGKNFEKAVKITVNMPQSLVLNLDVGVGQATISNISANVMVDMGVGEITVNSPRNAVGSVDLISGIGDVSLNGKGLNVAANRSFLVGARLDWHQGQGNSVVDIDLGIGEASVWLID